MSFPTTPSDTFVTKADRHAPVATSESLSVPVSAPYRVELLGLPDTGTVAIAGYDEVQYLPTQANEFFVDYGTASLYFHASNASASLTVEYDSLGSVLRASDLNALQDALVTLQKEVHALLNSPAGACRITATSPASTSLNLRGGKLFVQHGLPLTIEAQVISLATGDFALTAIAAGQKRVILFTVDLEGFIHRYEGSDHPSSPVFPYSVPFSIAHAGELFLAEVTVTDAGSGVAGDILNIDAEDIIDFRQCGTALAAGHMQLTIDPAKTLVIDSAGVLGAGDQV